MWKEHVKTNQSSTTKALFCVRPASFRAVKDRLPSAGRQSLWTYMLNHLSDSHKTPADGDRLRLTSYKCFQLQLTARWSWQQTDFSWSGSVLKDRQSHSWYQSFLFELTSGHLSLWSLWWTTNDQIDKASWWKRWNVFIPNCCLKYCVVALLSYYLSV